MQNRIKKIILSLWILLISGQSISFAASKNMLSQADSLFQAGLYTQALPLYETLYTKERVASPAMLLRMALIYEGLAKPTMALYMLNKYYLSRPDHEVLKKMADLAQKHQLAGYEYKETNYLLTFYSQYEKELIQSMAGLLLLCMLVLAYRRWKQKVLSPSLMLLSFVIIAALAFILNRGVEQSYAIIMSQRTFAYKEASGASSVLKTLPQGTRVVVVQTLDKWLKVKLQDQEVYINSYCLQPVY
jgi:hypothetical protein